jgi:hypothetical protein
MANNLPLPAVDAVKGHPASCIADLSAAGRATLLPLQRRHNLPRVQKMANSLQRKKTGGILE